MRFDGRCPALGSLCDTRAGQLSLEISKADFAGYAVASTFPIEGRTDYRLEKAVTPASVS